MRMRTQVKPLLSLVDVASIVPIEHGQTLRLQQSLDASNQWTMSEARLRRKIAIHDSQLFSSTMREYPGLERAAGFSPVLPEGEQSPYATEGWGDMGRGGEALL